MVRIHHDTPDLGGLAQLERATGLQPVGHRFDPDILHQACIVSMVTRRLSKSKFRVRVPIQAPN